MAIIKSAKKAIRSSARKRVFNLRRKQTLNQATKEFKAAPSAAALAKLYQAIDKSAKAGLIKKNNAARKKSRFSKMVKGK